MGPSFAWWKIDINYKHKAFPKILIINYELADIFDNFLVIKSAKNFSEKANITETQILLYWTREFSTYQKVISTLLKEYNVIQSISRAGTPRDTTVIESFFSMFKDVILSHF